MSTFNKIITGFIIGVVSIVSIAGYAVGSYFVDYAFKRGDNGMPEAWVKIVSKEEVVKTKPDFRNEVWTLEMGDENRYATAFYADEPTDKWIIMVHGYCRSQQYFWDYANEYLKAGYNVLTPDLNASGTSEGEYLTMGCRESDDIVGWSDEIAAKYPNSRIALHGVSMGAATVMLATAKELPPNVKVAIEDCGYSSAYDMFVDQLEKNYGLPAFPVMNCVDIADKIKTGSFLSDAAPIDYVDQTQIPMLFIHGDADKLVPPEMEEELYEASAAPYKKKIVVPGAAHADSMYTDKNTYFGSIYQFFADTGF